MVSSFSVDEVFEMAEMMERNGADFYRKTAEKTDDPKLKNFLVSLSNMEIKHEAMFRKWRKELAESDPINMLDPDNEGAMYLQTIVDGRVSFEHEEHGNESMQEILHGAIASEKDTVIFYLGIQEAMGEHLDRDKIGRIISEELGHIRQLTQLMHRQSFEKAQ
ncbi:MAG: rubrerythrin [Hyphomicrobiales bacterium]|nr:MAG: rubrerythrin [Hyphomicrobiales bacterium]